MSSSTTNEGCVGFIYGGIIKTKVVILVHTKNKDPAKEIDSLKKIYGNDIIYRYIITTSSDEKFKNFFNAIPIKNNDNICEGGSKSTEIILKATLGINSAKNYPPKASRAKAVKDSDEDAVKTSKAPKEPKAKEAKEAKEPKEAKAKEPKAKEAKAPKEPKEKVTKAAPKEKESKVKETTGGKEPPQKATPKKAAVTTANVKKHEERQTNFSDQDSDDQSDKSSDGSSGSEKSDE